MKSVLTLILLFTFLFLSCGKKETSDLDTKKDSTKVETPKPITSSGEVKLPEDFPMKNEIFKKAKMYSVATSANLVTIGFEASTLPNDVITIIDKELTKDGYKKGDEVKDANKKKTTVKWTKDKKYVEFEKNDEYKNVVIVYER